MPEQDFLGDIFVTRCGNPECGAVHVLIGEEGQPCLAKSVLTPDGARELAALLCQVAAEIEAEQPQGKRPH